MATPMIRQLKFNGFVMSSPAAATITVNGVEVYSGQIGVGQPIDQQVDLLVIEYNGQTSLEELAVSISVTSGVAKLGLMYANEPAGYRYGEWLFPPNDNDDGRTNILINGLPPEWPPSPTPGPLPGGTPENPIWTGWCFELSAGETMTLNYEALAYDTTN